MATITKYTYTIAPVDVPALRAEIHLDAAIIIAVSDIDYNGTDADVYMKDVLPAGEETALDAVAAAHTGTPLSDMVTDQVNQVHEVETDLHPYTYTSRFINPGLSYSATAIIFKEAFKISQVTLVHNNPTRGDIIRIYVYDGVFLEFLTNWITLQDGVYETIWRPERNTTQVYKAGLQVYTQYWAQTAGNTYAHVFGYHTRKVLV